MDKHRDKLTDEPRELLLFTLRELTGKDLGSTTAAWKKLLLEGTVTRSREGSETAADRDWKQFQSVAVLERSVIRDRTVERLKEELLQAPPARQGEILRRLRDGKGDEYTEALADAIGRLSGEAKNDTRQALVERLAKCTSTTLLAYLGSETAELRRAAALAVAVKEDKSLTYRLIQLLSDPEERVAHVAHAALKSLSGEDFGPAKEATREERAKAVAAWKAWWRKQTGR